MKIFLEKKLKKRIYQVYQQKIPYYILIGREEMEKKYVKIVSTYQAGKVIEMTIEDLVKKMREAMVERKKTAF